MPRRKRIKQTGIIPHSANPSSSFNPPKRKNNTNITIDSACCGIIHSFIKSIMKNFVIPSFAANIIGCFLSTYYITQYILNHFHIIETFLNTSNSLFLQIIFYSIPIICFIFSVILFSYLYLIIALILSPHGHDIKSYSVGRGRFNLYRTYLFIRTCFQTFETLLYFNSYFNIISSFLNKCKRINYDCDLNRLQYNEYSSNTLKRIISVANNRCLDNIENEQRLERNFLRQAHYHDIVKQDIKHIIKYTQTRSTEMISIFNIHFDKNDSKQIAHVFLPPSISLCLNYKNGNYKNNNNNKLPLISPTPVVIFLVGGAWGSCDITFSASAASSFVNSKIAFIYPTYNVFPNGNVKDMLDNIDAIIEWIVKYSNALNINPNHISIVSQSAGAHLGALAVFKAYQKKSKWLRRVRLFCGLAGPYCIQDHYRWESNRGIENISPMGRCMKGIHNFSFYSPTIIAQELYTSIFAKFMNNKEAMKCELNMISERLPYFLLIHSINDYIVPITASRKFKNNLEKLTIKCELEEYKNGGHYDSLFGLCDINNCLYNRLITDIISKIFICCTKYNKAMKIKRKLRKSQKLKQNNIIKCDNKLYDIYEDIEEEDFEEDIIETDSNEMSSFDMIQNENENELNEVKENNNSDMYEYFDEKKDEIIHFKGYKYYEQTNGNNNYENKMLKKNDISYELPIAENLVNEIITEDDEELKRDVLETDNGMDCELFKYDDMSVDINKSDEAIEFMKNLLKDMDIALDEICMVNNMTYGKVDESDIE